MSGTQTWRSSCGSYTVILKGPFLEESSRLARERYPNEVGTALVGSYSADGWQARVHDLAPLTPDSCGGMAWFRRGMRGLRSFFRRLFRESRGLSYYVGEWHSHPDGEPIPSRTDDRNMMDIASDADAHCPECLLVLLSVRASAVETAVFVYSRERGRLDLQLEC